VASGVVFAWFEATRPTPEGTGLHSMARAALAHVWFESIHPFEDGNGRLGHALMRLFHMALHLRE
jgi:Fic family protein